MASCDQRVLMHDLVAKDHLTRSALILFNAQLAVHYPAYTIFICQH